MFQTLDLAPMVLPEAGPWRREALASAAGQGPDFADRYDWTTLLYGAAFGPRGLVAVAPRLLNLTALLRQGRFLSDAGAHPVRRIRRYRRHDEVALGGPPPGAALAFEAGGLRLATPVRRPWAAGRRVLATISRDNALEWIGDWAAHHVRNQGAEAVLLFDNRSTRYTPPEILQRLRGIAGLQGALVVSAPCRYGPLLRKGARGKAKFLQSGLLNLARLGWLSDARSVLVCDIDEIALSEPGAPTLFEAAERGLLGYATAPALWRGAAPSGRLPRHGDHLLAWTPERRSKEKWAVVPSGRLGGLGWDVHGLGRYQFNRLCRARGIRFLHCEALSTDWKRPRLHQRPQGAHPDPATEAALRAAGLRDPEGRPATPGGSSSPSRPA